MNILIPYRYPNQKTVVSIFRKFSKYSLFLLLWRMKEFVGFVNFQGRFVLNVFRFRMTVHHKCFHLPPPQRSRNKKNSPSRYTSISHFFKFCVFYTFFHFQKNTLWYRRSTIHYPLVLAYWFFKSSLQCLPDLPKLARIPKNTSEQVLYCIDGKGLKKSSQ